MRNRLYVPQCEGTVPRPSPSSSTCRAHDKRASKARVTRVQKLSVTIPALGTEKRNFFGYVQTPTATRAFVADPGSWSSADGVISAWDENNVLRCTCLDCLSEMRD